MAEIRVLIVDDEPVARAGLRKLLECDPEIDVIAEAATGRDAVRAILEHQPDLLFLDIQMPEMTGFDVLHAVGPARMPAVVFVTAYDQYAVRAFEVQAFDYLLKPFDDERFVTVLERAKQFVQRTRDDDLAGRLEALLSVYETRTRDRRPRLHARDVAARQAPQRAENSPSEAVGPLTRIIVRGGGRVFFQPVEEIDWIEAADYYVRLHVGDRTHLVRETLATLEKQLDPARFVRVHRSAIVNVDRIQALRPDWRNRHVLVLRDGSTVPLSRGRKGRIERLLTRHPGPGRTTP